MFFFSQKLTFKRHISYITSRLASISSLFYRVKHIIPEHIMKIMYHAHVSSILNYCNIIWANTYDNHLTPLIRMQKRIIRNIARADFLAHTDPLFQQLRLLKIIDIKKLALATYFFKHRHTLEEPLRANHPYLTRQRNRLRPIPHNRTLFQKSFIFQAPQYWNEISIHFPDDSINDLSPTQFKNRMKSILLN